jgi:copper homeostasis protein
MTLVEICLDDVGGAAAAAAGGADRVELCAGLAEGGLTPTVGFVASSTAQAPGLEHRVLVRPRAGDFVHDEAELDVMCADIEALRPYGVGFVIGATCPDGALDERALTRLATACGDAPMTCHKAFDAVPDPRRALDLLIDLGFATVLTSGRPGPALEHLDALADLVARATDRIEVLVGGGVRPGNVCRVLEATGAPAVHLRAPSDEASVDAGFGVRRTTDEAVVAALVAQVRAR